MKKYIKVFIALFIFILSAWKLKAELVSINFRDVFTIVQSRSLLSIVTLILVSFLGIWLLSLYDVVLVRSQKLNVPFKKTMKISWIINSLNTLIGFGGVIGSTIRYNYFQEFTDSEEEKSTLFKSISLLILSMITGIGALSFLILFNVFSSTYLLDNKPILKIGLIVLATILPIFLIVTFIKPPVPSDRWLSFKYTCVSVLDYSFAGVVMFLSLRFVGLNVDFWQMESIFIIAAIAGLISMVPGGLGAFDVIFLLGMTQQFGLDKEAVLLALVFYRLTYYIMPFLLGLILSVNELQESVKGKLQERKELVLFTKEFGTIIVDITKKRVQIMIRWALIILFVIGTAFFFQDSFFGLLAISPDETNILIFLFATAYILSSIYIIPNLLGIYHGSKEAYHNLAILLGIIFVSQMVLFRELAFIEGFIFTVVLSIVLFLSRKNFTAYLTVRYRLEKIIWLLTLALLVYNVQSLYDTADYYELDIFNHFIAYVISLSVIWLAYLIIHQYKLRKEYHFSMLADKENMSQTRTDYQHVIETYHGSNLAHLGFLSNNHVLVDNNLEVACIYQETPYFVIVLGDPVGNTENFFPFVKKAHEFVTLIGKEIIFYQTTTENINIYTEFNYSLFNLGEEAEVDVTTFKITGNKGKVFRQLINKQEHEELTFQIEEPTPELLQELKIISDEWLGNRKEMSFSLGNFDEAYLSRESVATIRDKDGAAIAFASIMPAYIEGKISVDLIRWKQHDTIAMMDLLYLNLILWAKENNYTTFNLGMAPLSSSYEKTNGLMGTITTSVYQHSSSLYSFKGLRNYKHKFRPHWYPRYLVYPKRLTISQAFLQSYKIIHPK